MNFEKILDVNTPFNEEKLHLLDQLVTIFYTTKSNQEVNNKFNYTQNLIIEKICYIILINLERISQRSSK
jgi:hypothetical protein